MFVLSPPPARSVRVLGLAVALAVLATSSAFAQLRPLDPAEWRVWEDGRTVVAWVGGGGFADQRASLAGTEGRLLEAGSFGVALRTGRVAFEAGGTVQRFFRDERVFAAPAGDALPDDDGRRHDSGDYRIATVVRLTRASAPALATLRFGTRLPTTDNKVGLDRDALDFFALLGGQARRGALAASAEVGIGINGTRDPAWEQRDVLVYALGAEYALSPTLVPTLSLDGNVPGLPPRTPRGNEDLGEVRLGLRAGGRRWVRVELVRGFTDFSPSAGVIVAAGIAR
ncbi:MAG TPA: hypothetical protein VK399_17250 [Longimicrobiaceae bacterium]|nr:hypothetical protein [Longimicrobiaceae bacterium]